MDFFSPLEDLTFGVKPLIRVIFNKFDLVIQVFFLIDQLRHDTVHRRSSELNSISPRTISFHPPQFLICFELFC